MAFVCIHRGESRSAFVLVTRLATKRALAEHDQCQPYCLRGECTGYLLSAVTSDVRPFDGSCPSTDPCSMQVMPPQSESEDPSLSTPFK